MKFPDFFLVGASKAGTTAICSALARHPNICFSTIKGPNFFNRFDTNLEEIPSDELSQYQNFFHIQNSEQKIGEGSEKYLDSSNANYWIKKYVPSAKIIIILRNPVQRVVSLYEMYTRLKVVQISQDEAFSVNSDIAKECLLYEKLLLYIDSFSREQVLIMVFDDFLKNQDQAFHLLCQFIGVHKTPDMFLEERNKGGLPKSGFLKFLNNRSLIETAKKILPSSKHAQIDSFIKTTFFRKTALNQSQREEFKKFFYEDVRKIGDLIERDLCQEWQL